MKIALIAGIVDGFALILIILIIVLVVIADKKPKENEIWDINVLPDHHETAHNKNPIYDRHTDEDPFRQDFLENLKKNRFIISDITILLTTNGLFFISYFFVNILVAVVFVIII